MNHSLLLDQNNYDKTDSLIMTKHDPLYALSDMVTLQLKGQREQKVKYIKAIHTEKVNQHYCYLELTDVRPVEGQALVELNEN